MGIILLLLGIAVYYFYNVYFTVDKAQKSNDNKKFAKEIGDLSYFDYNTQSDKLVISGRPVRRLLSHDTEGKMYNYYVDKKTGAFLGAKYFGTNPDRPIKYRQIDIDSWLKSGCISSEDDLYKRWAK